MIDKWSDGVADENMAEDILTDLGGMIRRHPWWQARSEFFSVAGSWACPVRSLRGADRQAVVALESR